MSDLPDHWSAGARETFEGVLSANPDLTETQQAALYHAAALESQADLLDTVVAEQGPTALGSAGQIVVHPALVEARLVRKEAAAILSRLGAAPSARAGAMTNSERGRMAARARWGHGK